MPINFYIMLGEALVILFELRALMQSSSIDYYNNITQAVIKLTEPLIKYLPFRSKQVFGFYYAGFVVATVISLAFWAIIMSIYAAGFIDILSLVIISLLMVVKSFGYLVLCLLLAQALTSWLPSTRNLSYTLSVLTHPIVAPVQKIIPPIGMIDISLMIVMLVIFALNRLAYSIFGMNWAIL